jgi:NAD dependent epimerase/dehydratase family enzyme
MVVLRTGIVLDRDMPVFERLTYLTKLGLGGRISRGDQWVSWIHVADFLAALRFVGDQPSMEGVVHVTSPHPVQNRELMATLRAALHRPWSPPTPRPLVHVGALLMGTDPALALTGRRCAPRRLVDAGFELEHARLGPAINDLVSSSGGRRAGAAHPS